MVLEGKIVRDGRYWLVEVTALDVMTQGVSYKDALKMIREAVDLLVDKKGFDLVVHSFDRESFYIESDDEEALLALMLKRQRVKHHLTLSDMARKLGVKSKNAYAQYEQGRSQPSLTKVQEFLSAMSRKTVLALNVIEG